MKSAKTFRRTLFGLIAVCALASGSAMAQDTAVPGHPRVNEVNNRLSNQQNRTQAGIADGQIGAKQAGRDEKQDANIAQRESADEAKHNGHLTRKEDRNLNKSENHDSQRIRRQRKH